MDDWQEVKLERKSSVARCCQASLLDTAVRVADLAAKDSEVAIAAADDPDYYYYLLKVMSDGVIELPITDDYGCSFPRQSSGLKGFFFVRENIIDRSYNLNKNETPYVFPSTLRHLCGELQKKRNNIYKVALIVNEEIIASL